MEYSDLEEEILFAIEKDDIDDFTVNSKLIKNWKSYVLREEKEYLIHYAINAKALHICKYIIDQCSEAELNKKDITKQNILHLAFANSLCLISKMILAKFSFKLSNDINENTEFHKWVFHSCRECLVLLLQKSGSLARFKLKNREKNNPLHKAVIENKIEAVKFFLEFCDFDLNEKGEEDRNLLELAIIYSDKAMVSFLLSLDFIDINSKNTQNRSFLTMALKLKKFQIANILSENLIEITDTDINLAFEASENELHAKLRKNKIKRESKAELNKITTEIQYVTTQANSVKEKNFDYYTQMLFKNTNLNGNKNDFEEEDENKEDKALKSLEKKDFSENFGLDFDNKNKLFILDKRFNYNSTQITVNVNKKLKYEKECESRKKLNYTEKIDSFHKLEVFLNGFDDSDLIENEINNINNKNFVGNKVQLKDKNEMHSDFIEEEIENLSLKKKDNGNNVNDNRKKISENNNAINKEQLKVTKIKENYFKEDNNEPYDSIEDKNNNKDYFDLNEQPKNFNFYSLSFDKKKITESIEQKKSKFESNKIKESKEVKNFANEKILNIESLLKSDYNISFSFLEFSDLEFNQQIYKSDNTVIHKGVYMALPVAIKVYNMERLTYEEIKYFIYEVNLLMSLRHPNIVTFIGFSYNSSYFYLVTEYMEKKSLKSILDLKQDIFTFKEKLNICIDISVALFYLHSRNPKVLHRDLKSANCLVDKNNRVKLCDFGLSKIYENSNLQTNSISTFFWMAPEYLQIGTFSDKSDIYSLGILFWEIFMKDSLPYKDIKENCFLIGEANAWEKRPEFNSKFDLDVKALIELCWDKDPRRRPGIKSVIESLRKLQSVKFGN